MILLYVYNIKIYIYDGMNNTGMGIFMILQNTDRRLRVLFHKTYVKTGLFGAISYLPIEKIMISPPYTALINQII